MRATPFRPLAFSPAALTLTRLVVRPTRSRNRLSEDQRLGSLATRLWAAVLNTTSASSPETLGSTLYPSVCCPTEPTLCRSVRPAASAGDAAASSNAATAETAILPFCIPESTMARRADVLSRFSVCCLDGFIVVTFFELMVLSWSRDDRWIIGQRLNFCNPRTNQQTGYCA